MKSHMKTRQIAPVTSFLRYPATVALLFAAMPAAHADNTWDGGGGDGNWNTAANWGLDTLPSTGVLLSFSGNLQNVTNNNLSSATYFGINFTNDGTTGKTNAFTLAGTAINPGSADIVTTAVTGTAITDTISLNLTLTNNKAVNTGASHNLIISGAILNGSGQRNFSKTGAGELTLTNAGNTYGGTTSINGGILTVDVAGGIANRGVASALGNQTTAANAQLNFNSGTLNVKSGANSTDRQVRIGTNTNPTATGGGVITNNSTNGGTPLVFTSAAFNNTTDTGMNLVTVARPLALGGSNTDANAITGVIADHNTAGGGIVNVTKAEAGRWILSGANTYTGNTTISAGTLQTGASNVIPNASNIVLNGGTFAAGASFSDTAGTLSLSANSFITLGAGSLFAFADSSALSWGSSTLSISGSFVSGSSLRFGTTGSGLTSGQLSLITIDGNSNPISLDSSGFLVTAIPEPSAYAALAGVSMIGFTLLRRRRQQKAAVAA